MNYSAVDQKHKLQRAYECLTNLVKDTDEENMLVNRYLIKLRISHTGRQTMEQVFPCIDTRTVVTLEKYQE